MIKNFFSKMKTDLYTTNDHLLVSNSIAIKLPFRLVIWTNAIAYEEAERRVQEHGLKGKRYHFWENPATGGRGSVSVIETDDMDAINTIGRGVFATCYRVLTLQQAKQHDQSWRSAYMHRLMCRTRPPAVSEIEDILQGDEVIAYHNGYRPDRERWSPAADYEGTIYAIYLTDDTTAFCLKAALGDCDWEQA